MSVIRTTCPYCGVGCGIEAKVSGERSLSVKGDALHPANAGKLCSKGTHLGETVALQGRLLAPRVGGRETGWDEALDKVASRMRKCIDAHGPDSVAFYVSGQLLTEDYYVANKLMKGFIGSGNIDTNSRLCMASAVAAHNRAFGEDVVPCSYEDLDAADLILLVGSNTAWCHPVIWQRIEQVRERRGTKLVVIDPRKTETAERADLHVPIAPDGDIPLFNALLAEMRRRGAIDNAFLREKCETPESFWDGLDPGAHGIDDAMFGKVAKWMVARPRTITLFSQGANQSVCGTDKGNAIINLHLATGRINRLGAGPFSITGQPNAMGGREVGGLASTLACHLGFSDQERAAAGKFWSAPRMCSSPGLKAVDMYRAVHEGRIRFLWVMATNPAVSMPDSNFVREALERCETLVVSDVIAGTDTAKYADIVLPALAWGEKDGTVTNSERRVSRQRALFSPPGEARADWRILCDVAERMGWGDAFGFESAASVFREYARMTALSRAHGKILDLTAHARITDAEYNALEPFQWGGVHPLKDRFPTVSSKAQLIAVSPPAEKFAADYQLRLNTGRYRDQWHTMTRTGLSPTLSQHRREPLVEVHPLDAAAQGLVDGGLARVASREGEAVFRVHLNEGQREGEIFVPMHWTDTMTGAGRSNQLLPQDTDPHSGQPGFKFSFATIEPVTPEWRAFLVTRAAVSPGDVTYWTRSRVSEGWLYELAGMGMVDLDALLPEGDRLEAVDMKRGMRRIAVRDGQGRLISALYLTRSGQLPARDWIAGQLGECETAPSELLAGRPSQPQPDLGPMVCICHNVAQGTITDAANDGACDVAAIGNATRAGTNCGSCRPAIAKLLEEALTLDREAAE